MLIVTEHAIEALKKFVGKRFADTEFGPHIANRFIYYLCVDSMVDRSSGHRVCDATTLKRYLFPHFSEKQVADRHNFSLYKFLDAFKLVFPDFSYRKSYKDGNVNVPTTIMSDGLPSELVMTLRQSNVDISLGCDEAFDLLSGAKIEKSNLEQHLKLAKELISKSQKALRPATNSDAQWVFDNCDSVPVQFFSDAIKSSGIKVSDIEKECHQQIFAQVASDPKPRYTSSEAGGRLNPTNGIVTLPAKLRDTVLESVNCVGFDIANAQLSICAELYNLPEAKKLLASGKKPWNTFMEEIELFYKFNDKFDVKKLVKMMFYRVMFDGTRWGIAESLSDFGGQWNIEFKTAWHIAGIFLEIPLIKELVEKRDIFLKKIELDGGAFDAYGNWIAISEERKARSVAACVAQSFEFKLWVKPVKELCSKHKNVKLVASLHDGFWLSGLSNDQVIELQKLFEQNAGELGFMTKLEHKDFLKTSSTIPQELNIPEDESTVIPQSAFTEMLLMDVNNPHRAMLLKLSQECKIDICLAPKKKVKRSRA